jgi:hypothetical protein
VADVYRKSFARYVLGTKYWVRPLTRRLPPERLYRLVHRYVDLMWPLARLVRKIPRLGPTLNWRLLIADYSRELATDDELLREWAYLDTFDMLSPRFDFPQTIETARRWCHEAGGFRSQLRVQRRRARSSTNRRQPRKRARRYAR